MHSQLSGDSDKWHEKYLERDKKVVKYFENIENSSSDVSSKDLMLVKIKKLENCWDCNSFYNTVIIQIIIIGLS